MIYVVHVLNGDDDGQKADGVVLVEDDQAADGV
jgi:hypothetical protein